MEYTKRRLIFALAFLLSLGIATHSNAGRGKDRQTAQEESKTADKIKTAGKENEKDLKAAEDPKIKPEEKEKIKERVAERNTRIDEGLKQFPDSPVVNTAGSEAALNSRNVAKALSLGDKAVDLARQGGDTEEVVPALTARAQAKLANNDPAGALADIKDALELKKDDPQLLSLKGLIVGHAPGKGYKPTAGGMADQARANAAKDGSGKAGGWTATGRAGDGELHQQAQATKDQLDRQAALKAAADGMELDPRKSLERLNALLKGDPKDARVYALRAKADRLIGEYQAAHSDASTAIGLDNTLAMAYAERAVASVLLGYSEQDYLADWSQASQLDPAVAATYEKIFEHAKITHAQAAAKAASGASTGAGAGPLARWNQLPPEKKTRASMLGLLVLAALGGAGVWTARRSKQV